MDAPVTLAAAPDAVVPVSGAWSTLMGAPVRVCPAGKLTEEWCGGDREMPGGSHRTGGVPVRAAG